MVRKWVLIGNRQTMLPEHYGYQLTRILCFHMGTLDGYVGEEYDGSKILFCRLCAAVYNNK